MRVWIPARFAALDPASTGDPGDPGSPPAGPPEPDVPERLRRLLDRHRAAGVHVSVRYADDRWELGDGVLRGPVTAAIEGVSVAGTRLWPAGAPQPDPGGGP